MTNLPLRTPLLGALILGVAASSAAAQSLLQQYGEVVQASNEAVAALPGVTIAASAATGTPAMDLNGNMLWRAKLAGAVSSGIDDQALFFGRTNNDLQLVLRRGQTEPTGTLPGVTVTYSATGWDVARVSPENNFLLIGSTLAGTGVTTANDTCLFWGPIGSMQILAREGDTAPSGGAIFGSNISGALNSTAINSSGIAVCKVKLSGGDAVSGVNDDALLWGSPGGLLWCCREGDPINGGVEAVGTLDTFNLNMDSLGRVLFTQPLSQTLGTTPATSANDSTMMLFTPGSGLSLVAREGDPAPGSGACSFGTFSSSALSDVALSRSTGRVVITNSMTGGDVTGSTSDTAIFAGTLGGSFARIARESEPAPTGVPGEIYQAIFTSGQPAINENGTVVFVAQLGPTGLDVHSDVAVFMATPPYTNPGDVQMILREGQAVAGLPAGWIVDNTNGGGMSSSSTTLMLNDRDSVLINVAGVGDNTQANWGVPATISWDPLHGARAFYVQGDTFSVNGNPWITTSAANLSIASGGDGCARHFNNNGDVCFKLFSGSENAVVRGHVGAMTAVPSSVPASGGVPQNFHIDVGPSHPFELYVVLATSLGTRPGFTSPFGPQNIPLNFDGLWTQLSLDAANSGVWINNLGITDASGKGIGPAGFVMPTGFPGFAGTTVHHAAVILDLTLTQTHVSEASALRLY